MPYNFECEVTEQEASGIIRALRVLLTECPGSPLMWWDFKTEIIDAYGHIHFPAAGKSFFEWELPWAWQISPEIEKAGFLAFFEHGVGHIWLKAIEQNHTTGDEIFGKLNSLLG